jgi:hypothetical protein
MYIQVNSNEYGNVMDNMTYDIYIYTLPILDTLQKNKFFAG